MYDFYYKKDRLNQLRGFCSTVKNNSIVKASKEIGVEPGTISKQIRALERDLKTNLFDRETKKQRLIITDKGREFYKVAIEALQNIDSVFNYFKDGNIAKERKEIRIAAHHTAIVYMLPKCIERYKKLYGDDVHFKIINSKTDFALEQLYKEKIDLLIHFIEVPDEFCSYEIESLDPTIIMHKDNILASKKDNKITFEDLSKQNMIMIDRDNIIDYFVKTCDTYNVEGNIEFCNGDWEMIRNYIRLNLGIHLYSSIYDKYNDLKDDELIMKNVKHLFPKINLNITTKKGVIFNEHINNFIEIIKEECN